jgi:hypothetical protein
VKPWYENNDEFTKRLESVETFRDAYYLCLRAMNPLKKIPSEVIRRMFRRIYLTNDTAKMECMNRESGIQVNTTSQLGGVFHRNLNGTWELVLSLSDRTPYASKRYETGAVRVCIINREDRFTETVPGLWGMGTYTRYSSIVWNEVRRELIVTTSGGGSTNIPSQKKDASEQTFQVLLLM